MDVWIVSAKRTPIGKFVGGLRSLSATDLGVEAARAALAAAPAGVDWASAVELAVFGCARQAGLKPNPARQVAVRSGCSVETPAYTMNMACASGLKSITAAADEIARENAEVALAGGFESMTNVPHMLLGAREGHRLGHIPLEDGMYRDGFFCPLADMLMGETADLLAAELGITREESDRYAVESQARCQAARERGAFDAEIVPIEVEGRRGNVDTVGADEHPRDGVRFEKLQTMTPVFRDDGIVTAATASGINDGGAALLLASSRWAETRGLKPLARIGQYAQAAVDPRRMGLGPVPAVRRLLERTGRSLDAYDVVELNEAFAVQVIACIRELGLDAARTNPLGGAIALGHPIGCTGARLVVTLLHELRRRGGGLGLAALCVSGGLGMALEIEVFE